MSLVGTWRLVLTRTSREQREPDGTSAQVERELQGKMGNIKANAEGVPADAESAEGGGRCRQRQREGGSEEDHTKAGGEEETAWSIFLLIFLQKLRHFCAASFSEYLFQSFPQYQQKMSHYRRKGERKAELHVSAVESNSSDEGEIEKFQKGESKDEEKYIDVVINKNMKLGQKVLIPVKQFPKNLRKLKEQSPFQASPLPSSTTRVFRGDWSHTAVRRDERNTASEATFVLVSEVFSGPLCHENRKEEELRKSGEAKYFHLNDDLHVLIEVFAPPAEAYARMGHALEEIKKFLIPDYNDEIRQAQLQELTYLNGGSENADVPVVRGKPTLRTRVLQFRAALRFLRSVLSPPQCRGVLICDFSGVQMHVNNGMLEGAVNIANLTLLLAGEGEESQPGQLELGHHEGHRRPGASFPLEGHPIALLSRLRPTVCPASPGCEGDYDDGYGTAYDEQSYDSYENSYSTPAQRYVAQYRRRILYLVSF
ncbi:hypothetical protein CB1_001179011 [Camelus ferus]|nr:hypothetical protein CB1_001179011 [Camelus ferus]